LPSARGPRKQRSRGPAGALDGDDALRLGALRPLDRVELHLRALGERLEAGPRDRRMVDEHVLATVSRGDEPIPLRVVEPLDGSGCHTNTSSTDERTGRGSAQRAAGTRSDIASNSSTGSPGPPWPTGRTRRARRRSLPENKKAPSGAFLIAGAGFEPATSGL